VHNWSFGRFAPKRPNDQTTKQLRFAPKRFPFCGKMGSVLRQNGGHFAAKWILICGKIQENTQSYWSKLLFYFALSEKVINFAPK